MRSTRPLFRTLAVTAAATVALLGPNLAPSSAHIQTAPAATYNNGTGSFTATSAPNAFGCADYSNYTATMTFGTVTAEVKSSQDPLSLDYIWGEFVDGTYDHNGPNASCPGKNANHGPPAAGATGRGGEDIEGFTGKLSVSGSVICELTGGTYTRGHYGDYIEDPDPKPYNHPELNIAFQFATTNNAIGCPSKPVVIKTTIHHMDNVPTDPVLGPYTTTCNSPIAPQTCQLDPQENTSVW